MTYWMSGPCSEGVETWANVYVPDGTSVRNAKDAMVLRSSGRRPVRLVVGERDELVIDMSEDMAQLIADVLYEAVDVPATQREAGGAVP